MGKVGARFSKPDPAPGYLVAHACFACRKRYKISPRPEFSATCPNCGGLIVEMGRSFKAPPANDAEQWAKVQALHEAGFRFSSYRSTVGPPLPARLAEVADFIRDNPGHPMRMRRVDEKTTADAGPRPAPGRRAHR